MPKDKRIHPKVGDKTIEIDTDAPRTQGKRQEHGLAGDARPDRAPGESGRGDLSDTDRVGSHGQGLNAPPDPAGSLTRNRDDDDE
jgi:hypothetical protein